MSLQLDPTKPGFLPNVQYLARACELAYLPLAQGAPAFAEQLGLMAHLISVDNTQVYVGTSDSAIVVVFRGSESPNSLDGFKDWLLTNANNLLIVPEGRLGTDFIAAGVGARFHRGFMQALAEIWDPLQAAVEQAWNDQERPVWVTGHSLGGALALLAAWRFTRQFIAVHEVVTFGAPMVGNDLAAAAFEKEFAGKIFRYIDVEDPVPLLPTISLVANSYRHCPHEIPLRGAANPPAGDVVGEMAKSAVDKLLSVSMIDELWKLVHQRIAAHMLPNYQSRLGQTPAPRDRQNPAAS